MENDLSEFKINLNKLVDSNIKGGYNSVAEHPLGCTKAWVQSRGEGRILLRLIRVHCSHTVAGAGSQKLPGEHCLCHYLFKAVVGSSTNITPGCRRYTLCTTPALTL